MLPRPAARPRVRVLVVDDSVVVRRVVARALASELSMELVGVAPNGRVALERLQQLRPDVVILDLEMPEMDGYATLAAIRAAQPSLPVIVFSHLTSAGAAATLDALALGATGFAVKPRADGIGLAEAQVRAELLPIVCAVTSPPPAAPGGSSRRADGRRGQVEAVVVAVSTGGPNALVEIVPTLPTDLAVPVLIVQHMPAVFTRTLSERLDRVSKLRVVEAVDGEDVAAGTVYIAPGGRHMALRRDGAGVVVALNDEEPENSCRPAADVLFRSAAEIYGAGVLGVVLTGMGRDGLRGSEAVRAAGGTVIVQSAESAVVSSMPMAVAGAGLADAVLPLDQIGGELASRAARSTREGPGS